MTIPLADGTPSGVLDVTTHYFEFIPEEEGDSPQPTVLAAHELQEGRTYYILLDDGVRPVPLPHPRRGPRAPASTTRRRWSSS